MRRVYTDADRILFADWRELVPMHSRPHLSMYFVGPIPWSPDDPSSRLVVGTWTEPDRSSMSPSGVQVPRHLLPQDSSRFWPEMPVTTIVGVGGPL